ncbi:MAG: fumarylacetoacetate hydrolase family protein [Pseudomonadota bacterium]
MTATDPNPVYVIEPPPQAWVPVGEGWERFPVRRIYCVGRNYAEHAREMGGDDRDPPFFFQKPADALLHSGKVLPYPPLTEDLHHEVELVMALKSGGRRLSASAVADAVYGLAVGIDFTRRDLQAVAKKAGRPWEIGKAFDHSAAIAPLTPLDGAPLPTSGEIVLSVNGEVRQRGDIQDMVWGCLEIIQTLSTHYTLAPGDLIYTGTPAGVGPLIPGDQLEASVTGLAPLAIAVSDRD